MATRKEQLKDLGQRIVDDLDALADKYEELIGDELEALREKYKEEAISILLGNLSERIGRIF